MSTTRLAAACVAACLSLPATALASSSDLAVTLTPGINPVAEEASVIYTVGITNNGPDTASNIQIATTSPAVILQVFSASAPPGGSITAFSSTVVFMVPSLSSGQSTSGSIGYNAVHPGSETVNSTVGFNPVGSNSDPNNSNNTTSVTQAVTGLSAGGIDFGAQALGTLSPSKVLTVTNRSSQAVTLQPTTYTGEGLADFLGLSDTCGGAAIAVAATCTVNERFAPADVGTRSATAHFIPLSGTVDPLAVALAGTGAALPTDTGPIGPQGPLGPQGPAGAKGDPAFKLTLAAATAKLSSRRGRQVTLRYASTLPAKVVLDVLKGSKRIARVNGRSKTGANSIRWNGKAGRKAPVAGKYVLRLTATNGGQKAVTRVALKLTR